MSRHFTVKSTNLTFLRKVPARLAGTIADIRALRGDRATAFAEAPANLEDAIVGYWRTLRHGGDIPPAHRAIARDIVNLAGLYADLEGSDLLHVTIYASGAAHQPLAAHAGLRLVYESAAGDGWSIAPAKEEDAISPYAVYVDIAALRMGALASRDEQKLTEQDLAKDLEAAFADYNLRLNQISLFEDKDALAQDRKSAEEHAARKDKSDEDESPRDVDADRDGDADDDSYITDLSERALPKHDRPHGESLTTYWMRSFMAAAADELKVVLIWLLQKMPTSLTRTMLYTMSHAGVDLDFMRKYIAQVNPESNILPPAELAKTVSGGAADPLVSAEETPAPESANPPRHMGVSGLRAYRAPGQAAKPQDGPPPTEAVPNPHHPDPNHPLHGPPHLPIPGSSGES